MEKVVFFAELRCFPNVRHTSQSISHRIIIPTIDSRHLSSRDGIQSNLKFIRQRSGQIPSKQRVKVECQEDSFDSFTFPRMEPDIFLGPDYFYCRSEEEKAKETLDNWRIKVFFASRPSLMRFSTRKTTRKVDGGKRLNE